MPAKPIPEGYHTITPYLVVRDAQDTIDFLRKGVLVRPSRIRR